MSGTGTSFPDRVKAKLRQIAPHLRLSVHWEPDRYFRWDGDGPDPAEEGYVAHDVTVTASAIVDGEWLYGEDHLGGVYAKPGEPDPEISGYFLDMVSRAFEDLAPKLDPLLQKESRAAEQVIARAYAIQREEEGAPKKQDWSPRKKRKKRL